MLRHRLQLQPQYTPLVFAALGDQSRATALRVPSPGLIPLGTVDTGLDVIADAGNDFALTITALD